MSTPHSGPYRIYQIYYRNEQIVHLEPGFIPYDNAGDADPLLEFNVFRKILRSGMVDGVPLWGAVSWKFRQKTGMTSDEMFRFVQNNPGYDVYYCNPHVSLESIFPNLWVQGETAHPDFFVLCQEIFRVLDLPEKWLTAVYPSRAFASTNYIIASPEFWQAYVEFIETAMDKLHTGMNGILIARLFSSDADPRGLHAGASFLPFVIERLFAAFMLGAGSRFHAKKYALPVQESKLDHHQRLLSQMKDKACQERSLWMLACWVNYRNLYLYTHYSTNWINRYLDIITPNPPEFLSISDMKGGWQV